MTILPKEDQVANRDWPSESQPDLKPLDDLIEYSRCYAEQRPGTVAVACVLVGFVLGWKLKPW